LSALALAVAPAPGLGLLNRRRENIGFGTAESSIIPYVVVILPEGSITHPEVDVAKKGVANRSTEIAECSANLSCDIRKSTRERNACLLR
jgi:hypothetical protein